MTKILGLDLGTNSIGWAVVDEKQEKILGTGVRIFQEGVNRDSSGKEVSKNATRRDARQIRRQGFRKKLRRKLLTKELRANGMCPVNNDQLKEWFALNPYELRAKAIKEQINLLEIGRIFYHISQRRGFKSNRKAGGNEDSKIFSGAKDSTTLGINYTKDQVEKGYATLGEYLASIDPHKERRRNRYTTRQMYEQEFDAIWEKQSQYYPAILNQELKDKLGYENDGIIFFQRPLRSQKFLIGKCTFEPSKPKCPISAILFEKFRTWQFINTIRHGERWLTKEQRQLVFDFINTKDKRFDFKAIKTKLKMKDTTFNYEDSHKIVANYTIASLSKLFTPKIWDTKSDKEQKDIWHIFFSCDNPEWLNEYAKNNWGFDDKQLEKLTNVHLKQDYSTLSRKAISNILPYLERGHLYHEAVLLGGVINAFGKEKWEALHESDRQFIEDGIITISRNKSMKEGETIHEIKHYLITTYDYLTDKQLNKLYHHSQVDNISKQLDKLPEPKNLRNPIVQQAIYELRKTVNAITEEYGQPDEIKVELARDLKQSKERRDKQRFENNEREKENDEAKERLDEYGLKHSRDNIHKYLLWKESKGDCPYTGNSISIEELLGSNNKYQIEHIIPYSISLDDSFGNKAICEAKENQDKGNLTPFQFYGNDEANWKMIKDRAFKLLPYHKAKRFSNEKTPELDTFIERQLNDTRYISKEAKEYLKHICEKVRVLPGQATAELRHKWGLNSILNKEKENKKTRDDHRHHAVDALTVACTKTKYFQELSKWTENNRNGESNHFPKPWETFRVEAEQMIGHILVTHRNDNKVTTKISKTIKKDGKKIKSVGIAARGQLHKETVYGKRTAPGMETAFHVRKPLEKLNSKAHVDKIVDPRIHSIIIDRLRELNVDLAKKYKVPDDAFFKVNAETGKKEPLIFLPNKNGAPIPIRKVRIKENIGNAVMLKETTGINQFVNPQNNHHVAIYKNSNGELYETVVTLWDAVKRKQNKLPVIDKAPENGDVFITSLQSNEMFLLGVKEKALLPENYDAKLLSDNLYRVQKLTSGGYTFTHHLVSALKDKNTGKNIQVDYYKFDPEIERFPLVVRRSVNTLNGFKVTITPTGKIKKIE